MTINQESATDEEAPLSLTDSADPRPSDDEVPLAQAKNVNDDPLPVLPKGNNERSAFWLVLLILVLGSAATASLLAVGITSAKSSKDQLFQVNSAEFTEQIKIAWREYEMAAHFTHVFCSSFREDPRFSGDKSEALSMAQFRLLYEHLEAAGIDVQVEYLPLVLRDERASYEEHARQYYAETRPDIEYPGFREYNWTDFTLMPRSEEDFYYPLQYMEPLFEGDEMAIGIDTYSVEPFRVWLNKAFDTWSPVLSAPTTIAREADLPDLRGVLLNHPVSSPPPCAERRSVTYLYRLTILLAFSHFL